MAFVPSSGASKRSQPTIDEVKTLLREKFAWFAGSDVAQDLAPLSDFDYFVAGWEACQNYILETIKDRVDQK
jgi:hypothetical protein